MAFNSLKNLLLAPRVQPVVALTADGSPIHWDTFLADIRSLIDVLKTKKCSSIAICCENSYWFSVAFFACIYAQKRVVLPGNHQPAMLHSLSCEFELLIDDGLVVQAVKEDIVQDSILLPIATDPSSSFVFYPLDLNKVDITLFTSGSTGAPKAIKKSLYMLDTEVRSLEKHFGQRLVQTHIVSTVSHQHIYGLLFRVLWPLCSARSFAAKDLIYPEQVIANAIQDNVLISSPALLKRLEDEGKKGNFRAVFSSGGPLSSEASDACKALLNNYAIEVFGSTETGGIGFRQQKELDSAWTFFDEVDVKLGEHNCLALTSPWLNGEMKKASDDYYQTNDQCELLPNNQFRLKGRIDRIVKIEEKRISLLEVETHLNELKWISESVVIVVKEPHRTALGALLTLTTEGERELAVLGKGRFWIMLRQSLRDWVEPVGIPRHFRIAAEIPMNNQGKRLLQEIEELFR